MTWSYHRPPAVEGPASLEDTSGLERIDVRDLPPLERLMRVSERVSDLAADEALLVSVESSRRALTSGASLVP